jgi:hypothetical protein
MTLTTNPSWTKWVAQLIQYEPVASITTRMLEGTWPVAWSWCTRLVEPSGVWSTVNDRLARAPEWCVETAAVVAAISTPTKSVYVGAV